MSVYKYGFVDLSYLLMRNVFAASRGKKPGEFHSSDVVRMTIQTLNKISRDYDITVDKYIFFRDQWSKEYKGYYRTAILQGDYKWTREYITREKLREMSNDPNITPQELEEAELKCYINEVKNDAKKIIINELCNFGVPTIGIEGYEFDDLAYTAAAMTFGKQSKKNVIITKDSDLQYALTPETDFFRIPTGGSAPQVITYNEMYQKIPDSLKGKVSLYQYKAFLDSLGEGHNDMLKTKKNYLDPDGVILQVLNNDFSGIEDPDLFIRQYNTFMIEKFPHFDDVQKAISEDLDKTGSIGNIDQFHDFCDKYEISGISDRYFNEFINRFDSSLYGS